MRIVDPDVFEDGPYLVDDDGEPLEPRDGRGKLNAASRWWLEDDRLEILRQGYQDGLKLVAIAGLLGCTVSKAAGQAYRMGWRHPNARD